MRGPRLVLPTLILAACSPSTGGNEVAATNGGGGAAIEGGNAKVGATAANGPFGYSMGQAISDLDLKPMDKPGLYQTDAPPKPHPDFEAVVVEAYPSTGICRIRGVGKNIENDGSGASIRGKVTEIAEALATRYGEGHKLDHCSGGDIQCQSDFWMMTLSGGERYFGIEWTKPNAAMKNSNIKGIDVFARASDINTSYVAVEYLSSNESACKKAKNTASASSL